MTCVVIVYLLLRQCNALSLGVSELHQLLRPFLLRRTKAEVVKDLPPKTEVVLYHGMSAVQKKYYKAILTKDVGTGPVIVFSFLHFIYLSLNILIFYFMLICTVVSSMTILFSTL